MEGVGEIAFIHIWVGTKFAQHLDVLYEREDIEWITPEPHFTAWVSAYFENSGYS